MPRIDPRPDHALLVRVLRDPELLRTLSPERLASLMDAAQGARLLGWFIARADAMGVPAGAPEWLNDRVISARALVAEYDRALRWEMNRLVRALGGTSLLWVLLKGSGYLAAGLGPGKGRRVADVDILVAKAQVAATEQHLRDHGWEFAEMDDYDVRYYREWMHESPPMIHGDRGSIVDVHHAILPTTSRLKPPTEQLLERSREVMPGLRVLCPSHLILHAAAHLFHDGEVAGAIRDLVDLRGLLDDLGAEPGFWSDFQHEAGELDLRRPAFYAIRYAHRWLGAPVPPEVLAQISAWGPAPPVLALMDGLVWQTLFGTSRATGAAAFALYVRSHWLKMPPLMLIRHLWHKAFFSPR